ncbi:hypothetical protein [Paenibacillus nuruki]|uniref:hypothetical protein n=1 Tax=Paenibacillus nuruki TaxID=1886670 RepID=UPI0028059AF6|nr:hypothetical protein [Paenibacillus nuruki]CAJ1316625.1 hypothetical protein AASFL403_15475 [Paenibacillus nuruki]
MGTYLIVALLFVAIAAVLYVVKRKDKKSNLYDGLSLGILAVSVILTLMTLISNSGAYQWGSFLLVLAVSIVIVRRILTDRQHRKTSNS